MADVLYLAVGSAGAALVAGLVAGAGTQIASDHRAFIARVWRAAIRALGGWLAYALTELGPLLFALSSRPRRKSRAAECGVHKHRKPVGGITR